MKKNLFLFLLIFITANSFAQANSSYRNNIPIQFNDGLQTASLSDVDIDSTKIMELTDSIVSGYFPNIHSLLILRHGKLVYENYFPGQDEILVFGSDNIKQVKGDNIGLANSQKDSLHDLRSISKSFVSACIGIAIAQGRIKNENQNIWHFFPEYSYLDTGMKSAITIKDLLTMTSGLAWNEVITYMDSANSETQMDQSPDPIKFVLSRKSVDTPGTIWNYSGGNTQLLGAIIKKVSGMEVDDYAREYLFRPLGITNFYWSKFPSTSVRIGAPAAASGLRLSSRDMLKFGLLYMNKGKWKGKQIVPADWVKDSFSSQINRGKPNWDYGYQFWVQSDSLKGELLRLEGAVGNGDQRIYFDEVHDLVIVITAGNYNKDIKHNSWELLWKYILPALIKQ